MTTLEAVNEILELLGEPPATALDTGGTSIEAEAETYLDRANKRVQRTGPNRIGGWWFNTEEDVTLNFASKQMEAGSAPAMTNGPFTRGERVIQDSTGAVGIIISAYADDPVLVAPLEDSADFDATSTHDLVGQVSGAELNDIGTVTDQDSGVIPLEQDVLKVAAENSSYYQKIAVRDQRLWDRYDNTDTFSEAVDVVLVREIDFLDLSDTMQQLVVKLAAMDFQRFKKRGQFDERLAQEELQRARTAAIQEDMDMSSLNLLDTREAQRIRGHRNEHGRMARGKTYGAE